MMKRMRPGVIALALIMFLIVPTVLVGTSSEQTIEPVLQTRSNTIFFDNFDLIDPGWTHGGAEDDWERGEPNETGTEDPGPAEAKSEPNIYGTNLHGHYQNGTNSWLMSPVIDLTGFSSGDLSFWLWFDVTPIINYEFAEDPTDQASLEVALEPYDSWEEIERFNFTSYTESEWFQVLYDISPYCYNKVKFRFRLMDENQGYTDNGIYIDDFAIDAVPLPSNDVAIKDVWCSPLSEIDKPLNVTVILENKGINAQNNLKLNIKVYDSFGTLATADKLIVPKLEPLLIRPVYWNWKSEKYSNFKIEVEADLSTDEYPSDNDGNVNTRVVHFFFRSDVENPSKNSEWNTQSLKGRDLWHVKESFSILGNSHSGKAAWWCGNETSNVYDNNMDNRLITPRVDLSNAISATLIFWTNYTFEDENVAWDGGIVEASNNQRDWDQIYPKKASDYNGVISSESGNSLRGRSAFAHSSKGWKEVEFILSDHVGGMTNLSFRMGSDLADGNRGWFIDDITIFGERSSMTGDPTCAPDPISRVMLEETGDRNITISWEVCPAADFSYYNIYVEQFDYQDVWGMDPYASLSTRVASEFTISGLENGVTYYIAVTALDSGGNENKTVETISAAPEKRSTVNQPPTAVITMSPNRRVGENIYFYSRDSYDEDLEDEIVKAEWYFGDGSSSDKPQAQHSYRTAGTYNVTLIITDSRGKVGKSSVEIEILEEEGGYLENSLTPLVLIAIIITMIIFLLLLLYLHKTKKPQIDRYLRKKASRLGIDLEDDDEPIEIEELDEYEDGVTFKRESRSRRRAKTMELEDEDDGAGFRRVKDKPLAAKVVGKKNIPKSRALVADADEEEAGSRKNKKKIDICSQIAMIKCPSCSQVIKIKTTEQQMKEGVEVKCPVCDQEGYISW